ncbi:MAG: hypothetical protein DMF65_09820 [Acidobacteria bacterium]|nr:MAG: hypothetical protein DMF65_09820 [Acidobacteriota bacterium]
MTRYVLLSAALLCTLVLNVGTRAQTDERARAAAEIESLREQIKAREAVLLSVSREDEERYASFLAQPRTGLTRLLPREKWDGKLSTRGGGAYYSFARLTHEYGYGSDIELQQGQFSVGFAGADFGFLVNLGDMPLENVSLDTEAVRPLAGSLTDASEKGARVQQRRAAEGFKEGERTYAGRLAAVAGNTYALRSVNYDGSDVLVAFRVVRADDDGSVVLLWKMLKRFPKPTLDRSASVAEH